MQDPNEHIEAEAAPPLVTPVSGTGSARPPRKPATSLPLEAPPALTTSDLLSASNIPNQKGQLPIHRAVANGNLELASSLIASSNTPHRDNQDENLLHYAALQDPAFVKLFIEKSVSANVKNIAGETPLHFAVFAGSKENVRALLLKAPLTINAATNYIKEKDKPHAKAKIKVGQSTPLHYALSVPELNPEIVEILSSAKDVDINLPNQEGETPHYLLMQHPSFVKVNRAVVESFIKNGVTTQVTKATQSTVLHAASKNKDVDNQQFEYLVTQCKNSNVLDYTDKNGRTALFYCVASKAQDRVWTLLSKKANPNTSKANPDKTISNNPLNTACAFENSAIAIMLIKNGADVNAVDPATGHNPFQVAVLNQKNEILSELHTASAKVPPAMLAWAVQHAIVNNLRDMLMILIRDYKANPATQISLTEDGYLKKTFTAMTSSAKVDHKAGLMEGDTALIYAIKRRDVALVTACLETNANSIGVANSAGKKPDYYAVKVLSPEIAFLLHEGGCRAKLETSLFGGSPAQKTPLTAMSSRKFKSAEELTSFFTHKNHGLNSDQTAMLDKITAKYAHPGPSPKK